MIRLTASSLRSVELCPARASLPRTETTHADATAGTEEHSKREASEARPGYRSEVPLALNVLTGEARELPPQEHRAYPTLEGEGWIYGTEDTVAVEELQVIVEDFKSGYGYIRVTSPLSALDEQAQKSDKL